MGWDDLLAFVRRFPRLPAFNAALIALQRPDATFVDTEEAWLDNYGRRLDEAATALVILHPFGPVRFVYDIADTSGGDMPVDMIAPAALAGPPTWDGVHTVLAALRKRELLPTRLPTTRSPTGSLMTEQSGRSGRRRLVTCR